MATEYTDAELMHLKAIHDFDSPMSTLNRIEMLYASVLMPKCHHCDRETELMPMYGTAWGIGHIHEPGCPDGEDFGD